MIVSYSMNSPCSPPLVEEYAPPYANH